MRRPERFVLTGAGRREGALLLLRAFLGATFVYAGVHKLADPAFLTTGSGSLHDTLVALRGIGPFGGPAAGLASHAGAVGWLVAIAEIAVGLATLAGIGSRVAAACGTGLVIVFWLTVDWSLHPFYQNPDPVYAAGWLTLFIAGPAHFSVDYRLSRRPARRADSHAGAPSRRHVLGVAIGGVAATTGVLALAGRLARTGPATTAAAPAHRVRITDVPVGGALLVGRRTVAPVWIVQPTAGHLVALSGTCTHASCPVQFVAASFELDCPCHGSRFDARTGAVLHGPAVRPLPSLPLSRSGADVIVG